MIFFFYKSCSFEKSIFLHFLYSWSISPKKWSYFLKAKLISLYRVYIFNFTLILWHIYWKLWTEFNVSCRLGKHLDIWFLFFIFFYNLPSLRRLRTQKRCITHKFPYSLAPSLSRSIYSHDRGNSTHENVAPKNAKFPSFYHFFLLLGILLLKAQFNLVVADILKIHGVHPVLLAELPGFSISLSK